MAITVESLERERQARLKEAVAGEPSSDGKDEKRERLQAQIKAFSDLAEVPTCKSYKAAESMILRAMKAGKAMVDVRLDLTHQKLQVVPADVLRLGDSLMELSVVGNLICELPADLDLCRRLRILNLAANELSGLPNLSDLPDLAHVGLAFNRVDDRSLPLLVRNLPTTLQSLDLGANDLCSLPTFLETTAGKFDALRHLTLKGNPLCLCHGYKLHMAASHFSKDLSLLDGVGDLPAASDAEAELAAIAAAAEAEVAAEAAAAAEAEAPAPAPAEDGGEDGGGGGEAAVSEVDYEAEVERRQGLVRIRVTIEQLKGVPERGAEAAAGAPAPAPAPAEAEADDSESQLLLAFSIMGERRKTKPVPRAGVIDFEETSVELCVERTPALRDQLLVHGIQFEVLAVLPPSAPEGEEGEPPADGADGAEEAEPLTAPVGTITTHWEAIGSGEQSLTQVCSSVVQPPPPPSTQKKRRSKPEKLPPPFTLALTATVAILPTLPPPPRSLPAPPPDAE